MNSLQCPRCGETLVKKGDKLECPYCGAAYEDDSFEKAAETLQNLLSEENQRKIANARRLLWDATHEPFPSKNRVLEQAHLVLSFDSDDPLAKIYKHSHDENPTKLIDILTHLQVDPATAGEILRWLLNPLNPRVEGAMIDFADRHFKNKERTEWRSKIEEEMAKERAGFYQTSIGRDVFLCYSSADMPLVIQTLNLLERNGFECFAAFRNLRHGKGSAENYKAAIEDAMRHCSVLVFLSSKHSRSFQCDALTVELAYLTEKLPSMQRVEYLLEDYEGDMPYLLKRKLKEAFPSQEQCRHENDLLDRVYDAKLAAEKNRLPAEEKLRQQMEEERRRSQALLDAAKAELEAAKAALKKQAEQPAPQPAPKPAPQPEPKTPKPLGENSPEAIRLQGKVLFNLGQKKEAVALFKLAAEKGDPAAMYNLGHCYFHGEGVKMNVNTAFSWYKKAAKAGDVDSMVMLAECYEYGDGTEENPKEAFAWYSKAAALGDATGMNGLGTCYQFGSGVAQDEKKAFEWYKKAADKGESSALFNLAGCYYEGSGVAQDYAKAIELYQTALKENDPYAQFNVGVCYYEGKGVTKDQKKGLALIEASAKQNHEDAKKYLEKMKPAASKQTAPAPKKVAPAPQKAAPAPQKTAIKSKDTLKAEHTDSFFFGSYPQSQVKDATLAKRIMDFAAAHPKSGGDDLAKGTVEFEGERYFVYERKVYRYEPIEWVYINKWDRADGDLEFYFSKICLDFLPFGHSGQYCDSNVRAFLKKDFLEVTSMDWKKLETMLIDKKRLIGSKVVDRDRVKIPWTFNVSDYKQKHDRSCQTSDFAKGRALAARCGGIEVYFGEYEGKIFTYSLKDGTENKLKSPAGFSAYIRPLICIQRKKQQ